MKYQVHTVGNMQIASSRRLDAIQSVSCNNAMVGWALNLLSYCKNRRYRWICQALAMFTIAGYAIIAEGKGGGGGSVSAPSVPSYTPSPSVSIGGGKGGGGRGWSIPAPGMPSYISSSGVSIVTGGKGGTTRGSYTVSWGSASGSSVRYDLYESALGGAWSRIYSGTSRSYSRTKHTAGNYSYKVRACNRGGCGAYRGNRTVSMALPPGRVGTLYISNKSNNADTTYNIWWYAVGGTTRYELYRRQASYGSSSYGGWSRVYSGSYRNISLNTSDGHYQYYARACNSGGCGLSSGIKNVTVIRVPGGGLTPAIGSKSNNADGAFTLSWGASRGRVTRYELYQRRAAYGSSSYSSWSRIYSSSGRSISRSLGEGNYQYYVRACNEVGCGGNSGVRTTTVLKVSGAGSTPAIGSKVNNADGAFTLSWGASSGRVTRYELYQRQAAYGSSSYGSWSRIYSSSGRSISRNLSDGNYQYYVRACNESGCGGNSGVRSTTVLKVSGAGSTPAIGSKTNNADGAFTLSWGASSGRVTRYELYQRQATYGSSRYGSWSRIYNSSGRSISRSLGDGNYQYYVRACNESGCGGNSGVRSTTVLKISGSGATPAIGSKTNNADGTFTLSWNASSGRVTRYELYQRQAAYGSNSYGSWSRIYNSSGRSISRSLGDGNYQYYVRACNESGCGGNSGVRSTTVLKIPGGGATPAIGSNADGDFTLSWGASSGRVTRYELYQRQAAYGSSSYGSWSRIYNSSGRSISRSLDDGNYQHYVRACNESGCGGYSGIVSTQVLAVPQAPTSVSVPDSTNGAFHASINYSSGLVQRIQLQHSINNAAWSDPVNYNGKQTSLNLMRPAYTTGGALANYRFRVAACNDSGCSAYSTPSNSIRINPPGTPASFSASNTSHSSVDDDGSFDLNWSPITTVSGVVYDVEESTDGGNSWTRLISGSSNSSYSPDSKAQGDYRYQVRACLAGIGCGDWTHPIAIKVAYTPGNVGSLNLPATDTDGTYNLSWSAPSGTVTHYQVEQNGSIIEPNPTTTNRAFSAQGDNIYSYRVRACNDVVCSSYSSVDSIQVLNTPSVPLNIGGDSSSNDQSQFWLRWSAPASGSVTQYQIKTSDSPHHSWSNPINNGISIEKSFSKASGTYSYQVRACNQFDSEFGGALNCGPTSSAHSVTVLQLPVTPTMNTAIDPTNDNADGSDYLGTLQGEHSVGKDGSFNYRIPIEVPPGINGMQPDLALSYNSNRRNGLLGWGWSLSGLSVISRCPADHVRDGFVAGINPADLSLYPDNKYRYCLDGQRLVNVSGNNYRTENEQFLTIEKKE